MSRTTLTPRQRRFVEEYTLDLCGKDAAIRAGYSANRAKVTASELLTLPKVAAAVEERQRNIAEEMGITRQRVLKAFLDIADRAEDAGNLPNENRAWENVARLTGMMTPGTDDPAVAADIDASIRALAAELERND